MSISHVLTSVCCAAILAGSGSQSVRAAGGPAYPNKPIRFVTSGTGGSSDFVSRMIAQNVTGGLGQQVIVDNRTAGVMPGAIVARAPADGYTLLVTGSSHW